MTRAATTLVFLFMLSCTAEVQTPPVQASSPGSPGGRIVNITPEGDLAPSCLTVNAGQTVEFRNQAPLVPTNITSLGEPTELFSPNLLLPYNKGTDGDEVFAFWRHTFASPGVFEYYDTNGGDPGKKVVDPYYGTVTFVGISDSVHTGVICVKTSGGDQCEGVCCVTNADCPKSQCCDTKNKRCVLLAPDLPPPLCHDVKPAFREFDCFVDSDCADGVSCNSLTHTCVGKE